MRHKIFIFSIIGSIFFSCKPIYQREKFSYHFGDKKDEWINTYKMQFFINCLRKGYLNDTIFKLISEKDLLFHYEPFALQNDQTEKLAFKLINNLPRPIYPHTDNEVDDKLETKKNYICASCLNYYSSKELDSIAKIEYKKYLSLKNTTVFKN